MSSSQTGNAVSNNQHASSRARGGHALLFARNFFRRLLDRFLASSVVKSVIRHGYPDTDMNRSLVITSNLFLHVFPVKVKKNTLRFKCRIRKSLTA